VPNLRNTRQGLKIDEGEKGSQESSRKVKFKKILFLPSISSKKKFYLPSHFGINKTVLFYLTFF